MNAEEAPWSIRSVVVSVRDLDRSAAFYQDVMNVSERIRENQVAMLCDPSGSFTIFLRQAYANASHPGHQSLGIRSLSCNVGSVAELDRVEARLRANDAFVGRRFVDDAKQFEMVHGHDPDRVSLTFLANKSTMPLDEYHRATVALLVIDM
jgi:catechol-2,3-dioxygenase